jgi:transaldolase
MRDGWRISQTIINARRDKMKIYGAGSLEDIRKSTQLGVVGILTNPQGFEQYFGGKMTLREITESVLEVTHLPVFIQIHGRDADELVDRGRSLHALSPQVGFKIISGEKGFWAIRQLQREGINCIATTLFTISQAAVAANVGAFGICPFFSRARENGIDSFALIESIKHGYEELERAPQIVTVSLRNVGEVDLALKAGSDAVGMRYPLIEAMMQHPLSRRAEALFARNWKSVKGEDVSYLKEAMELEGIE